MNRLLSVAFAAMTAVIATTALAQGHDNQPGDRQAMRGDDLKTLRGPHGGSLHQTGGVQIETVVESSGLKLFVYDRAGEPIVASQGRGIASLRVEGGTKRYRYDLLPDDRGVLMAPINLTKIAGRQIELKFQLVGINTADSQPVAFNEVAMVPVSPQQLAAAAIARQKVCAVSGKPLGSMGDPVAIDVQGQTVYVCCAGCVNAVKADPGKYLAIVHGNSSRETPRARPAGGGKPARPRVAKATAADAPFVAAQKLCPVMDEPLDAMGGPYRVNADGRAIYICCPGCAKKIAADPQKYLMMLAEQGVDPPVLR